MSTLTKGERVERHTSETSLKRIREQTIDNVRHFGKNETLLNERIKQLEDEWDIERYLETNASIIAFVGTLLGAFVHEYWLILPGLVLAFLFQHAIQGWCPPLGIFRRLGKRTQREIEIERNALKALRGDYKSILDANVVYNEAKKK